MLGIAHRKLIRVSTLVLSLPLLDSALVSTTVKTQSGIGSYNVL